MKVLNDEIILYQGGCLCVEKADVEKVEISFACPFQQVPSVSSDLWLCIENSKVSGGNNFHSIESVSESVFVVRLKRMTDGFYRRCELNWKTTIEMEGMELLNDVEVTAYLNGMEPTHLLRKLVSLHEGAKVDSSQMPQFEQHLFETHESSQRVSVIIEATTPNEVTFSVAHGLPGYDHIYLLSTFRSELRGNENNLKVVIRNNNHIPDRELLPAVFYSDCYTESQKQTLRQYATQSCDVWVETVSHSHFNICLVNNLDRSECSAVSTKVESTEVCCEPSDESSSQQVTWTGQNQTPSQPSPQLSPSPPATAIQRKSLHIDYLAAFADTSVQLYTSAKYYFWYREQYRHRAMFRVPTSSRFQLKSSGVVIEGDSLLLYFLNRTFTSSAAIDSNSNINDSSNTSSSADNKTSQSSAFNVTSNSLVDFTFGCPSLHLCYLVHQYLASFTSHGVKVTVIFFSRHRAVYCDPHYRLLREIVITSLQNIPSSHHVETRVFGSFLSTEFTGYLRSRLDDFSPLELVLLDSENPLNLLYTSILLDSYGVAVGDISSLDLLGEVSIYDTGKGGSGVAEREAEPAVEMGSDGVDGAARSVTMYGKETFDAETVFVLQEALGDAEFSAEDVGDGDATGANRAQNCSSDTECTADHGVAVVDGGSSSTSSSSSYHPTHRSAYKSAHISTATLKSIIGPLSLHDDAAVAAFAESHLLTVDIQSSVPLSERFLPEIDHNSYPYVVEFHAYYKLFCEGMLQYFGSSSSVSCHKVVENENKSRMQTPPTLAAVSLQDTRLFIGDLWDGRLLAAVHLFRCHIPLSAGRDTNSSGGPMRESDLPYSINCSLVDRIREFAVSRYAANTNTTDSSAVVNILTGGSNYSQQRSNHTIAVSTSTATAILKRSSSRTSSGISINDSGNSQYGADSMGAEKHTHNNRALTFGVNEHNFRAAGRDKRQVNNAYIDCDLFASSVMGRHKSTNNDHRHAAHSHSHSADRAGETEESLLHQKEMDRADSAEHKVSGQLHLDAIRRDAHATPLGAQRPGWASTDFSDLVMNSQLTVLKPRYNALNLPKHLESELRASYMLEEGFKPEPWQLSMLECIDNRQSVLIIAPTSSGKTLAAEYAMRKICRDNALNKTRFVGVFVQPTNALVDQTYGVFAVDPNIGESRVAMFTAEVRSHNFSSNSFEVLVTNPQCLQILLMSGHTAEENPFYKRLRCVVFDEIHCIGQDSNSSGSGNGVVWEQLLVAVDCPIVGLSATLANATPFYEWLTDIKVLQLKQRIAAIHNQYRALSSTIKHDEKHSNFANIAVNKTNAQLLRKKYNRLKLDLRDKTQVKLIVHSVRTTPLHFYRKIFEVECSVYGRVPLDLLFPVKSSKKLTVERHQCVTVKYSGTCSSGSNCSGGGSNKTALPPPIVPIQSLEGRWLFCSKRRSANTLVLSSRLSTTAEDTRSSADILSVCCIALVRSDNVKTAATDGNRGGGASNYMMNTYGGERPHRRGDRNDGDDPSESATYRLQITHRSDNYESAETEILAESDEFRLEPMGGLSTTPVPYFQGDDLFSDGRAESAASAATSWIDFKIDFCDSSGSSEVGFTVSAVLLEHSCELALVTATFSVDTVKYCRGTSDGGSSSGSEIVRNDLQNITLRATEKTGRAKEFTLESLTITPRLGRESGARVPYAVHLERSDHTVVEDSFNPLCFLTSIDHSSDTQLSSFFEALPHMKLSDVQTVFCALFDSSLLQRIQLNVDSTAAKDLSTVVDRLQAVIVQSGLAALYAELRSLFEDYFLNTEKQSTALKPLELAAARLKYDDIVSRMHGLIVQLPRLDDRLVIDALCCYTLNRSGLDWYGQQWLEGFSSLDDSLGANIPDLLTVLSTQSVVHWPLKRLCCCLFANETASSEGRVSTTYGVYPSSITAVNRGAYYFLHLLLKRDGSGSGSCDSSPSLLSVTAAEFDRETGADAECGEDPPESKSGFADGVVSRAVRSEILTVLRQLAIPPHSEDHIAQTQFSASEVATLLRGMLQGEDIRPVDTAANRAATSNPLAKRHNFIASSATVKAAEAMPNEVRQPTLIFHLNKKAIERFVCELVDSPALLDQWFVSCKNDGIRGTEGCFLTLSDMKAIDALPNTSESKKKALKYGIGMHVATIKENRKYRRMVELLFQQKKLKFVFATSSLSYGINMPCSDVLFLGDSVHLSNMVFRQSSGRAGRRGYSDHAGRIYFVGFPLLSIVRKLCMPIENLTPRQAISPAYILRLTSMSSTAHTSNKVWVDDMALRGLMNPLFERLLQDSEGVRDQFRVALVNSVYFSWSFLHERGYLNHKGVAQVKANVPYREHYLEPRCFLIAELFHAFLDPQADAAAADREGTDFSGYLGLIGAEYDDSDRAKQEALDLQVFLSLVFFASYSEKPHAGPGETPSSGCTLAPSLRAAWETYNRGVMDSLINYMRAQCTNFTAQESFPLNETIVFPTAFNTEGDRNVGHNPLVSRFIDYIRKSRHNFEQPFARSVFTLLSGRGDYFLAISELLLSVKSGMLVDKNIIPSMDPHDYVNRTLETTFLTGKLSSKDNNSASACEDFSRDMRGVVASLEQMYDTLRVKPAAQSKAAILMRSFIRVREKFKMQLNRAKGFNLCRGIVESVFHGGGLLYYLGVDEEGGTRLQRVKYLLAHSDCTAESDFIPAKLDCVEFILGRGGKRVQSMSLVDVCGDGSNNTTQLSSKAVSLSLTVGSVDRSQHSGSISIVIVRSDGGQVAQPHKNLHSRKQPHSGGGGGGGGGGDGDGDGVAKDTKKKDTSSSGECNKVKDKDVCLRGGSDKLHPAAIPPAFYYAADGMPPAVGLEYRGLFSPAVCADHVFIVAVMAGAMVGAAADVQYHC